MPKRLPTEQNGGEHNQLKNDMADEDSELEDESYQIETNHYTMMSNNK